MSKESAAAGLHRRYHDLYAKQRHLSREPSRDERLDGRKRRRRKTEEGGQADE